MISLRPKKTVFFDLFESLAGHVVAAAGHLQNLATDFPDVDRHIQLIHHEEQAADELEHRAIEELDRTFIAPFDREDIHAFVGGLDDIIDTVDSVAKRFPLYHVQAMEPAFVKQTQTLVSATRVLHDAVARLRKSRKLSDLSDRLIEIHHQESIGDDQNHAAMSELYSGRVDPLTVMKWKALYDLVEEAIDRCEDVGNTMERIVLKNG